MLKMTYKSIQIVTLFSLLLTGCIKEPTNNQDDLVNSFDRKAMLENLCDQYIIPGYAAYYNAIVVLEQNLNDFELNTSGANFELVKTSYTDAAATWQGVSFLDFGPAMTIILREQTNVYPIDTAIIIANISSGTYDLTLSPNYTAKGWQALDFMLHFSTDTAVARNYLATNTATVQYCKDLVSDLKLNADYVLSGWGTYADEFKDNSASNASGSAVSEIINSTVSHYETYIRKGKIGIPVGIFNGFTQQPMPESTEGYFSESHLTYADATITYYGRFLNGSSFDGSQSGSGLLDYANYVQASANGTSLSTAVNAQFEKIHLANDMCIEPWSNFVLSNPPTSNDIYLEYQKLIPLLKVDLSSALGVIIVYQDNDGD